MADNGTEPEATEDDRLVLELVAGKTLRAAAAAAGMSERTAHRRQQDPQFRERVLELRRMITEGAVTRLAAFACDAVDVLHKIATDGIAENDRIKAAALILEHHLKYTERADVLDRLRKLEAGFAGCG